MDQHPLFGKSGIRSQSGSRPTVSLKTHIGNLWTHYTFIRVFFWGILFPFWGFHPRAGNAWVACSTKHPPSPNPVSHVNQLSTAINPFPPQKLDLFIKLSITPPLRKSALVQTRLCDLFGVIHYTAVNTPEGKFTREASSSWYEVSCFNTSQGRKRPDSSGYDSISMDVHKSYLVKSCLRL